MLESRFSSISECEVGECVAAVSRVELGRSVLLELERKTMFVMREGNIVLFNRVSYLSLSHNAKSGCTGFQARSYFPTPTLKP